jgi:hypothetical protein
MVSITYRTLGPWGSGKGANLQPGEVDNNFWSIAEAIVALETNPAMPVGIASITVSGTQMYITLTDSTVLGPYTLPVLTFRWRGEWEPNADYVALDVVTVTNTGIFMCQVSHTSGDTFDIRQEIGGTLVWLQLFGSVDARLSGLSDVVLTDPLPDTSILMWNAPALQWHDQVPGSILFQDYNNVYITGGKITGIDAPQDPGDVVNKAYVDALPGGMTAPTNTMMSNISGMVAAAIPNTLSDFLDAVFLATTQGTIIFRGASGWTTLPPGANGNFLKSTGADPIWDVAGSGVTSVAAGTGISTGAGAITATGTVSLATAPNGNLLANISGASAAPLPHSLSIFLDSVLTTTRGALLTRTGVGWQPLLPGSFGLFLKSTGSGADLVWDSPAGAGTVTSISAGTGISTGGAPITSTGSVSLAAVANQTLLANISGASAAPAPASLTTVFDAILGATRGLLLYRSGTGWQALAAGTSGQILSTGGTAADPSWINAPSGAPIANLQLLANLSGSTAVATGQTLSAVLDATISSARGTLLFRGASGWTALAPGTSGQVLQTGGAAGDPSWVVPASSGNDPITLSGAVSGTGTTAIVTTLATVPIASGGTGATTANAGLDNLSGASGTTAGQLTRASGGTWSVTTAAGGGTVTSLTAGAGITLSPTTITTTGSIALSSPVSVANGGTGLATINVANLISGNGTSSFIQIPPGANGTILASNGSGTTASFRTQNILLDTMVGTGTQGQILYRGAAVWTALNAGTAGQALITGGAAANPAWGTLGIGAGGTGATSAAAARTNLGAVNIAGDTMTGTLTVTLSSGPAGIVMNAAAGQDLGIYYNGARSWVAGVTKTAGEYWIQDNTAVATRLLITGAGACSASSTWAVISDERLKREVEPYPRGLPEILALEPVQFMWTGEGGVPDDGAVHYGLTAQAVEQVMPELIREQEFVPQEGQKGEPMTLKTYSPTDLTFALIAAVKELAAANEQLAARLEALEAAR